MSLVRLVRVSAFASGNRRIGPPRVHRAKILS